MLNNRMVLEKAEEVESKPKPLSKEYLFKRGRCCGSRCLNCPYYPRHLKGNRKVG